MEPIFISYRRSDSQDVTGRIYDRLLGKYTPKEIFKDVDNIPLGVSFPTHIRQVLSKSSVVLVIIGPNWTTATFENGLRRLDDPNDFVRLEVETALRADMPVIPVLVSNARMPVANELPPALRSLASRNGMSVRPDPDFNNDIGRLLAGLDQLQDLLNAKLGRKAERKRPGVLGGVLETEPGDEAVKSRQPPASQSPRSEPLRIKSQGTSPRPRSKHVEPASHSGKKFVVAALLLVVAGLLGAFAWQTNLFPNKLREFIVTGLGLGDATPIVHPPPPPPPRKTVVMDTSKGKITIELFEDKAPTTVKLFLKKVDDKFYDGTYFGNVTPSLLRGGYKALNNAMAKAEGIKNESDNGLSNVRGAVSLVHLNGSPAVTARLLINVGDNKRLDKGKAPDGLGHPVFGKVIDGMAVVDSISKVKIGARGKMKNVPMEDIVIKSIRPTVPRK